MRLARVALPRKIQRKEREPDRVLRVRTAGISPGPDEGFGGWDVEADDADSGAPVVEAIGRRARVRMESAR
jgi:hypothetical protein